MSLAITLASGSASRRGLLAGAGIDGVATLSAEDDVIAAAAGDGEHGLTHQ